MVKEILERMFDSSDSLRAAGGSLQTAQQPSRTTYSGAHADTSAQVLRDDVTYTSRSRRSHRYVVQLSAECQVEPMGTMGNLHIMWTLI